MSAGSRPGGSPSRIGVLGLWHLGAEHRVDLDSDVHTLRRIVLANRGVDWVTYRS